MPRFQNTVDIMIKKFHVHITEDIKIGCII